MALGVRVDGFSLPVVDRRMLMGGLLAAVAAIGVLQLTKPPEQTPVLVAEADLSAGQPLSNLDVGVRYVDSPEGLVIGDALGELSEWSLRVPLKAGEPLVRSLIQPPELVTYPNVIALSLAVEHAVLGRLVSGDLVDIYATDPGGFESDAATRLLASRVFVVEATTAESSIDRGTVSILLAVDEELAGKLAIAMHSSEIDLVRVAP